MIIIIGRLLSNWIITSTIRIGLTKGGPTSSSVNTHYKSLLRPKAIPTSGNLSRSECVSQLYVVCEMQILKCASH